MNADACPEGSEQSRPAIRAEMPAITPTHIDSLHEVFWLWEQHDILIILADSRSVLSNHAEILDRFERSQQSRYITQYARCRYAASRTLAKLILAIILQENSLEDVILEKEPTGGIRVAGEDSVFLCVSYAHNLLALAFAHSRVGIDIEYIRPLALRHIPSLVGAICGGDPGEPQDWTTFLQHWTAMEAYAKYSNSALWKMLQSPQAGKEGYTGSYIIFDSIVLSLVTEEPCPPHRMRCVIPRLIWGDQGE